MENYAEGKMKIRDLFTRSRVAVKVEAVLEFAAHMHLRSLKKIRKDVSINNPTGTDREGKEITLIIILVQRQMM